jgi:hypothetical protein
MYVRVNVYACERVGINEESERAKESGKESKRDWEKRKRIQIQKAYVIK